MSGDEQDAAMLRLVKERREVRQRKALIESELQSAGRSLYEIGTLLKHINGGLYDPVEQVLPQVEQAPEICGLNRLKELLKELKGAQEVLAQLNRSAVELGVDG